MQYSAKSSLVEKFMKIKVSKIKKESIFTDEYLALTQNNELDFERKKVCVLYGPNGTGKTSLSKVLNQDKGVEYTLEIGDIEHNEKSDPIAHVISDQNDRNVIKGETQDFILGDDIKREYQLKQKLNDSFSFLLGDELVDILKKKYQIAKKSTNFNELILDTDLLGFIADIANSQSRGKKINREDFIDKVYGYQLAEKPDYDEAKLRFFIEDFSKKDSIIRALSNYNFQLNEKEQSIVKLEEQSEAVLILNRFNYIDECLVCDHPIDVVAKLAEKKEQYAQTSNKMDKEEKEIAEKIIKNLPQPDSFNIKDRVRTAITKSDKSFIEDLVFEFNNYKSVYWKLLQHDFITASTSHALQEDFEAYQALLKNKPSFGSEDILFIEQFLNESLEREISLGKMRISP
ncbi:hypothetical protein BC354_09075 [Vibrio cholerae]|nr:hypothetical protein BC354_09075 [Vibrio cholerae]RGP95410.1 hypothetical protein BC352_09240 [Vibrio cholerae]